MSNFNSILNNLIVKISLGGILAIYSFNVFGQMITKPLFMQIKSPKLESCTGISIDSLQNTFVIPANGKDSIYISFKIIVPKEMLSEKWAISLTPSIQSTREDGVLKDVVLKGWKFAEAQEEDYQKYDSFVNSIVDSSLYEKAYLDRAKLEKEIEQRHDKYWKFYYDEWERQIKYEIWKAQQDGSSRLFSVKNRKTYREQLYNQYLIRIRNQASRYLKAEMDTAGLHEKYMIEFEQHDAKMPQYFVDNDFVVKKVPGKYKDIYESQRTLDDITESMLDLLEKKDSALMALLPTLDYGKIIENEKKSMMQEGIFDNLVQLPKNENAMLDTVVYDFKNDYDYIYTYSYPVKNGLNDTIKVKLRSKILATDLSGFSSDAEEAIVYYVINEAELPEPIFEENFSLDQKKNKNEKNLKNKDVVEDIDDKNKMSLEKLSDKLNELSKSTEVNIQSDTKIDDEKENNSYPEKRKSGSRIQVVE